MESTYGADPTARGTSSTTSAGTPGGGAVRSQVSAMKDQAQHRAIGALDDGKNQICEALEKIASALDDDGGSRFGGYAADYARRGCEYLRGRSADELWRSASEGMRARPAALVGISLLGGFAFARMLRR